MHFSVIAVALSLVTSAIAAPVPNDDGQILGVGDIVHVKRDPTPEENIDVLPGGVAIGGIGKRSTTKEGEGASSENEAVPENKHIIVNGIGIGKRNSIAEDDLLPGLAEVGPVHVF